MNKIYKFLTVLGLLLISTTDSFAANKLVKLTDHTYAYLGTHDFGANNSFGANSGVVIGDHSILVIDTQISSKRAQALISEIRKVTDKPIKYVANTHWHADHTFGNADFKDLGAQIIAHQNTVGKMKQWSQKILDNGWSRVSKEEAEGTRIAYPQTLFKQELTLDLGGVEASLIYSGHSHTIDSIYVVVAKDKVLFAGDILWRNHHANLSGADADGWLKALKDVAALDIEKIVPGHGVMSEKKDLTKMATYIKLFDAKASEFSKESDDINVVTNQLLEVLPPQDNGISSIKSSLKWKYMRKAK